MRKINFPEPKTEAWERWRGKCKATTSEIIDKVMSGADWEKGKLFNAQKKEYTDKRGPFRHKCVYCEAELTKYATDLDHYRPAKEVTEENGELIKDHKGYYWLTNCWKNLLPACAVCNREYKKSKFPVGGKRYALEPGEEKKEEPLLINPVLDDPNRHLKFDPETYMIEGESEEGKMTVKVLGFHDREELMGEWKKAVQDTMGVMSRLLNSSDISIPKYKKERDKYVKKVSEGKEEYSFIRRKTLEHIL